MPFGKYEQMGAYHWEECDRSSRRYNPPLEARYEVVVNTTRGGRVLDIGCGDGYLTGRLSRFCENVVGVDFDSAGIKLASEKLRRFPNCKVAQASSYELPFDDKSFDTAVLADVIEHLEMPEKCLSEIRRVLKPGGTLIVTTPKRRSDRTWDSCHIHEYTDVELRSLLTLFFAEVKLIFFWPLFWSKLYATRYGWWLIRYFCRYFPNPFLKEGDASDKYGQILAICKHPQ